MRVAIRSWEWLINSTRYRNVSSKSLSAPNPNWPFIEVWKNWTTWLFLVMCHLYIPSSNRDKKQTCWVQEKLLWHIHPYQKAWGTRNLKRVHHPDISSLLFADSRCLDRNPELEVLNGTPPPTFLSFAHHQMGLDEGNSSVQTHSPLPELGQMPSVSNLGERVPWMAWKGVYTQIREPLGKMY